MLRSVQLPNEFLWGAVACALVAAGCGPIQVPAIDPTGQRIFLPPPHSTTLTTDSCCPRPVFTTPPPPPPCPPGFPSDSTAVTPLVVAPASPVVGPAPHPWLASTVGGQQLTVSPSRIIAPVGSEVVLISGLNGPQGALKPGHLIQWSLSRDSVGNFVDVNRDDSWLCAKMFHRQSTELSSDFATTRTLGMPRVITRGTLETGDDVTVPSGHSWLSVTSSSEGTSYVSVAAPASASWSLRRQTATVHWVDVQWTLPSPTAGQAGAGQMITTTVLRETTGQPIAGWVVRYELVDEGLAWLGAEGRMAADVPTTPGGQATVQVLPRQSSSGATRIKVSIIRPPSPDGTEPQLVVGEAWTTVAWNAPGLSVDISGPETLTTGVTATYRIDVSNTGDRAATNVVVTDLLPPALEFLNSQPAESAFGDRLVWNLGDLPAGTTRQIVVNCRARMDASLRHCASARCDEGIEAEDCVATDIFTPSLSLRVSGPEAAEVGQPVDFFFDVTNTGPSPITDVVIRDEFDPGLEHVDGLVSPIEKELGVLQPRESRRIRANFRVTREGRPCHRLSVTAAGGHEATAVRCITVTRPSSTTQPSVQQPSVQQPPVQQPSVQQPSLQQPAPSQTPTPPPSSANLGLTVRKTGPPERRVGEIAEYVIEVTNTGEGSLTGVTISDAYESSLEPSGATEGWRIVNGELTWTIASLDPGQSVRRQVNCRCLRPDLGAQNRATVTTDQEVGGSDEITTRILEGEGSVGPNQIPRDGNPNVGQQALSVRLADSVDPLARGEVTKYTLSIQNLLAVEQKQLVIAIRIPEGMKFQRLTSNVPVSVADLGGGRRITLKPINVIRSGEKLDPIFFEVQGVTAGVYEVVVEVGTMRLDAPVSASVQTRVNE